MLRESGHRCWLYDPFYEPDEAPLAWQYDFVTCTETAEHFHAPGREFARLSGLVKPGGVLAVMTCFQVDDARFRNWHYRLDPTHVCFYRHETFEFLAAELGWVFEAPAKNVAFLTRPLRGHTEAAGRSPRSHIEFARRAARSLRRDRY